MFFLAPFIQPSKKTDLLEILDLFIENGVQEIIADKLHLKPGIWTGMKKVLSDDEKEIYKNRLFHSGYYNEIFGEMARICSDKVCFRKAFSY